MPLPGEPGEGLAILPSGRMVVKWRRVRDSNPRRELYPLTRLAGERLQPTRPTLHITLAEDIAAAIALRLVFPRETPNHCSRVVAAGEADVGHALLGFAIVADQPFASFVDIGEYLQYLTAINRYCFEELMIGLQ